MRPPAVRAEAARQLRLSIQRFGKKLSAEQMGNLAKLPAMTDDAGLKDEVARIAAGLTTDAGAEGNRLKQFEPSAAKPAAPKEAEKPAAPKEKEADK